jgi:hypothetical protein
MRLEKLRQIDLNLLIVFAVTAAEKGATKASARLFAQSPAVSRGLQRAFHVSGRTDDSLVFRV